MQALATVLDTAGALPLQLRMAVVALDCLTRCGGAAACEAALGWWAPPPAQGDGDDDGGGAGADETETLGNGHANPDEAMPDVSAPCPATAIRVFARLAPHALMWWSSDWSHSACHTLRTASASQRYGMA